MNIDNMTEKQIDAEMQELHKLSQSGEMTPAQARRLDRLRDGIRTIKGNKRSVYWL